MKRLPRLTISVINKGNVYLGDFIRLNSSLFKKYPVIVIDSGRGEELKEISSFYVKTNLKLHEARKRSIMLCKTEYIFFLDTDEIVPEEYPSKAIEILEKDKRVGAVSIFNKPMDHFGTLPFGVSIWRTKVAKELYDFNPKPVKKNFVKVGESYWVQGLYFFCECLYMWDKLMKNGYKLETLDLRATHLKRWKYGH